MVWQQVYDPLSNMWLSTLLAAIPVVVMLVGLGFFHMKAHLAAGAGLITGQSGWRTSSATARASMLRSSPTGPSFSAVLALTLT